MTHIEPDKLEVESYIASTARKGYFLLGCEGADWYWAEIDSPEFDAESLPPFHGPRTRGEAIRAAEDAEESTARRPTE